MELLRRIPSALQNGYVLTKIVLPDEPGIDPADFTVEGWEALLSHYEQGQHKDVMLLGGWPGEPENYFVASLIWNRGGLFRFEAGTQYLREVDRFADAVEPLIDLARFAWANLDGVSGWANLAVAGEPEQTEEVQRLVAKWRRKSSVTLVDLTPPGRDPVPVTPRFHGPCWLTLLSAGDVVATGGIEGLDARLPEDVRLELFEEGGVLIQLTPSPVVPDEDPAVEAKYQALAGIVAPLAASD